MTHLEARRRRYAHSQHRLAELAGVPVSLVSMVENGWATHGRQARKLAAFLGLPVEALARPESEPIPRAARPPNYMDRAQSLKRADAVGVN